MTTMVKDGVFQSPSGFKVKASSYKALEAAADVLRPQLPKINREPFALDCLRIFEETLRKVNYNYRVVEIEDADEYAAFTIPELKIVALRIDVYDKLCAEQVYGRSTVIHEVGHIGLQHHVTLHRGALLGQHEFCQDSEWQAKAITAALMMPAEAARIAKSPQELALLTGTSEQAARFRIKTLVRLKLLTPSHSLWEYGAQQ